MTSLLKIIILTASILSFAIADNASININKYFQNCDKPLDNGYFKTCYKYEYKSATASYIKISGDNVDKKNIKLRFEFTEDKNIPEVYRTKDSDWTNSGCDRGHIQSDASNDYSEESRNSTYLMSNITMQYPQTNRRSYLSVEKRERELAVLYKYIESLTLIRYTDKSIKGIRIPQDYIKIFWNKDSGDFKECYLIKNDNIVYTLEQMKIDCSAIE